MSNLWGRLICKKAYALITGFVWALVITAGYTVVISAIKANEESALLRSQLAAERKAKPAEKCSELKTAGLKFCVADNSGR